MGKKNVKKLVFDEDSRREFVTGFQKRKLARKKKAAEEFEQQLKEAKKQIKEKIRETFKKVTRPILSINDDVKDASETEYELPEHIIKVKELIPDEIAEQHNWIGRNRMRIESEESQDTVDEDSKTHTEEVIPGMSITSLKQVKKMITNQAGSLMQNSEVFKKKNKLERLKNRKKAALKRNLLRKEKKKLKGRKRK
ncbi:nucleolar protein 12 [Planococcus citri]|uniref:nucleolar protein 12 n=1 Tax=Planococcus citri TaxID=170843 RepID=UPI0031F8F515